MRTNIEIDDELMNDVLAAGPFKTKKEAVEAGLRLLARQAAYREILKWKGKLKWEGDENVDWTQASTPTVTEPLVEYRSRPAAKTAVTAAASSQGKRRARR